MPSKYSFWSNFREIIMEMLNYILRCITNDSRLVHYTFISLKDGVALVFAFYIQFLGKRKSTYKKSHSWLSCVIAEETVNNDVTYNKYPYCSTCAQFLLRQKGHLLCKHFMNASFPAAVQPKHIFKSSYLGGVGFQPERQAPKSWSTSISHLRKQFKH